jgi:MoaA/NifB/PqqE/SkfB family radical SAM enzyme
MCQIWKHNNEQDIDNELNGDDIYKIIKRNNLMWVSLAGGEPFLSKHIFNIMRISMLNCKLVSVVSNGSAPDLIDEVVWDSLRKTDALLVFSISLEGDRKTHDNIVGVQGSYDSAIKTIEKLKQINNSHLYLGIETLLSNRNDSVNGYVKYIAEEYKIGLTYTVEQQAPYYHNVNGAKPAEVAKPPYIMSIKPFPVMHNLFVAGMGRKNRKLCEAGRYSVFIDPYANVYPCLLQAPNNPIKNLRETDYVIGDISEESKELYQNCQAPCHTPCEVYASMLFRPWRLL